MLKNFLNEFKKFAMRGNVIDMAVGIIIGAAFGKIVDSLVKDVIMPPLGLLLGKVDFANMFWVLKDGTLANPPYATLDAAQKAGAVTINIGVFINVMISFIIVAFAVFILIKAVNKVQAAMDKSKEDEAPKTRPCPYCCSIISVNATKCPNCTSAVKKLAPTRKKPAAKPEDDAQILPKNLTKTLGKTLRKLPFKIK